MEPALYAVASPADVEAHRERIDNPTSAACPTSYARLAGGTSTAVFMLVVTAGAVKVKPGGAYSVGRRRSRVGRGWAATDLAVLR